METKNIDKILQRISILFYVFVALFIINFLWGFIYSIFFSPKIDIVHSEFTSVNVLLKLYILIGLLSIGFLLISFVQLLIKIGTSIKRKNIFAPKIIRLINQYSLAYFIFAVYFFIGNFIKIFPTQDESPFAASFISDIGSIIMLLIFAQVLKLGCVLKQEQELTI